MNTPRASIDPQRFQVARLAFQVARVGSRMTCIEIVNSRAGSSLSTCLPSELFYAV